MVGIFAYRRYRQQMQSSVRTVVSGAGAQNLHGQTPGIWRVEQPGTGVPGYSPEARNGELCLGMGPKRPNSEEYRVPETVRLRDEHCSRSANSNTLPTQETLSYPTGPPPDLPPYVPPPEPAILHVHPNKAI